MTNYDLEDIYLLLSWMRFQPQNFNVLRFLDQMIVSVGKTENDTNSISNIDATPYVLFSPRIFIIIPKEQSKIIIEDKNVVIFFQRYFLELKYLCLTERYEHFSYLVDCLDNFPEAIIKNNYILPFRTLKKWLTSYWRKYDKYFLKDFIRINDRL